MELLTKRHEDQYAARIVTGCLVFLLFPAVASAQIKPPTVNNTTWSGQAVIQDVETDPDYPATEAVVIEVLLYRMTYIPGFGFGMAFEWVECGEWLAAPGVVQKGDIWISPTEDDERIVNNEVNGRQVYRMGMNTDSYNIRVRKTSNGEVCQTMVVEQ